MKKAAQRSLNDGTARVRRWWSRKYNRPANDPLFDERSASEHIREMYEDLMVQREELREELEEGPTAAAPIMKRIDEINRILGDEPEVEDPLVEEWERALERGEEPDL